MAILIYGSVALIVAIVSSLILYSVAKGKVRSGRLRDHALTRASALAPFFGLAWLLVAFLIHVAISNEIAHQDCGLSGDPYVTLPNRFVVGSLDTTDGYVVAPGYRTGVPSTGPGYVRGIIDLHWKNDTFSGTYFDFNDSGVRGFSFDSRDLDIKTFPATMSWHTGEAGQYDGQSSYWKVYFQYRHHWPKYIFILLILAGEAAIAYRVWKLWTAVEPLEQDS